MRFTIALITVFTIGMAASTALAQEKQPTSLQNDVQVVAANKKPKNEVELMLENARQRGETIIYTCLENCDNKPAAQHIEIEGFDKGRPVRLPKPSYPRLAREASITGAVIVQVIIDLDGSVIAANVNSGHPLFHAGCLQAARESMFTTSKLDGKPVKVTGEIVYRFSLPFRNRSSTPTSP